MGWLWREFVVVLQAFLRVEWMPAAFISRYTRPREQGYAGLTIWYRPSNPSAGYFSCRRTSSRSYT